MAQCIVSLCDAGILYSNTSSSPASFTSYQWPINVPRKTREGGPSALAPSVLMASLVLFVAWPSPGLQPFGMFTCGRTSFLFSVSLSCFLSLCHSAFSNKQTNP